MWKAISKKNQEENLNKIGRRENSLTVKVILRIVEKMSAGRQK